ncbi:hypothetical protein IFR04_010623 [Cadophora malorum]|uniref:Uncharacterized protein n=1 Tax=Cadophora malorum TaxID=108018 RepID=A0A8H7T7F9_9HELO|nr:hypothetical protein IFR04_010623 [Cadophora malorum]
MNSETLVVGQLPLSSSQIFADERADLANRSLSEPYRNRRENISNSRPVPNINQASPRPPAVDRAVKPKSQEPRTFTTNIPTAHHQHEGSETREDHPCFVPVNRQSTLQNSLRAVTASPVAQHPQELSPDYTDLKRVPGTDQNIYPRAPISVEFHERYPQLVDFFKQAVDSHKFLKYHTSKINYELRSCGSTPSNAVASIIIFCAEYLFKDLRSLLNSKHIQRQYQPVDASLRDKFQFTLSKPRSQPSAPIIAPFKIVYWRETTTPTQRRSAMEHVVAKSHSFLTMCGSLVKYGDRTSTLGLLVSVDSKLYGLTVDHLFGSQRGEEQSTIANEPDILPDEEDSEDDSAGWPWIDDVQYEDTEVDTRVPDTAGSTISVQVHTKLTMDHGLSEHQGAPMNGHKVDLLYKIDTATPYLDWALIEFDDGYYERPNAFYPDGNPANPKFLRKISPAPKIGEVNVFMISGVSGTRKGVMLKSNSYIGGRWGENLCQAWNVILSDSGRVIDGDCGSLIADQDTLEVYGHVVASNPLGEAYVVPLQNTLNQISNALGAKESSLPDPGLLMNKLVYHYSKAGDSGVADEAKQLLASMEELSSTNGQPDIQEQVRRSPTALPGLNASSMATEELERFGPFSVLIRRRPENIFEDSLESMRNQTIQTRILNEKPNDTNDAQMIVKIIDGSPGPAQEHRQTLPQLPISRMPVLRRRELGESEVRRSDSSSSWSNWTWTTGDPKGWWWRSRKDQNGQLIYDYDTKSRGPETETTSWSNWTWTTGDPKGWWWRSRKDQNGQLIYDYDTQSRGPETETTSSSSRYYTNVRGKESKSSQVAWQPNYTQSSGSSSLREQTRDEASTGHFTGYTSSQKSPVAAQGSYGVIQPMTDFGPAMNSQDDYS